MIRKFECWHCKQVFEADDKSWVECPHCHSDNVEYATMHMPRWVYAVIIAIPILLLGAYGVYKWQSEKPAPVATRVITEVDDSAFQQEADSAYIAEGNVIEPSLFIETIEYNEESETYQCKIGVNYPPSEPWKIVVKSYYGDKEVASSDDGTFEALPYSKDDGFYRVVLVAQSDGRALSEERDMPDFAKQITVKKGWSAAELERVLNSSESLVDNPYISDHHKVVVSNKPAGDTSETGSLPLVQDLIQMCSLSAKVEAVEYDDMNKISFVKLHINYPADWMSDDDY